MPIKTLFVIFRDVELRANEINQLRGYLNERLGWQDSFFHNHTEERGGVIYRYPRIQYRSYEGCAAMFGIHEGYDALDHLLRNELDQLPALAGRFERLEQRTTIQLVSGFRSYSLRYWLGLNTIKNRDGSITNLAETWRNLADAEQQQAMLQRILTAQLLKFCGEMGCRLPSGELQVQIQEVTDAGQFTLRSQTGKSPFQAFHLRYKSNLLLPDYVAFGKGSSKGFGWQREQNFTSVADRRY